MLKEILEDTKIAMDKSLKALDMTYKKIRTGRAHPSIMEEVKIEYYENGNKEGETHYKDGELDGLRTIWSEDGKKTFQGTFKDGNEQ